MNTDSEQSSDESGEALEDSGDEAQAAGESTVTRLEPPAPAGPATDETADGSGASGPSSTGRLGLYPGDEFGRFKILEEIGRGGMGRVYRALDRQLDREVALKLLAVELSSRPRDLERFRREAALASKLRHPRIVGVYSFDEVDGHPYFTMPLVEGRSLKQVIADEAPLEPEHAARIILEVARAIDAAHQQRVVHRDLKPANILLDGEGLPLVLDFGLAKDLGHGADLTRTGELVGTPAYMSPEQARGEATDHRVDVFALGAILYELVTGKVPYLGDTAGEVLHRILTSDPLPPRVHRRDLPFELETVCLKALAREPMFRYLTAGALAEDLSRFLSDEPVLARRPGILARAVRTIRTHRIAATVALVALVALVVGGLLLRDRFERDAAREQIEKAMGDLDEAERHERRGDIEGADRAYNRAYVLAEEAYADLPTDDEVRDRFLRVLELRARFFERQRNWTQAEELFERLARYTGRQEHQDAFRRAQGRAEVSVAGLREGEALDFVRWDRQQGRLDPSVRARVTADEPQIKLRAGSYVATHRLAGEDLDQPPEPAAPRMLLLLERGRPASVDVAHPGEVPPGMVYVPAASFVLGRANGDADEQPVEATAGPVWIDRTEVTVSAYREFLAAVAEQGHEGCGPDCPGRNREWSHRPPGFPAASSDPQAESRPVTGVTWFDAAAYAFWKGKRLPTEAEWELAAGGIDGRLFPWGDRWEVGRANFHQDVLAPIGAYPGDESPYGVQGLAGNGDEWCQDAYPLPDSPQLVARVIRGGVWYYGPEEGGRIDDRTHAFPGDRFRDTGFRCAQDLAAGARARPLRGQRPLLDEPMRSTQGRPPLVLRLGASPRYARLKLAAGFRADYRARTGREVIVQMAHEVQQGQAVIELLERGDVDLVTVGSDLAARLIELGLVAACQSERLDELFPAFQRPPFLQAGGQTYGVPVAYGAVGLLSLGDDQQLRQWSDLWEPSVAEALAAPDDGALLVALAARELGLDPSGGLGPEELKGPVRERLLALLRAGLRVYGSADQARELIETQGVRYLADDGIVLEDLERRDFPVSRSEPPGPGYWVDSWMISARLNDPDDERAQAARAFVDYALAPGRQRELIARGYSPTNSRTVRLLDKRSARARLRTTRDRLEQLAQQAELTWRSRARYEEVWRQALAEVEAETD